MEINWFAIAVICITSTFFICLTVESIAKIVYNAKVQIYKNKHR
jgi:putative effector of murein hydrolase LrgA (UPF0299 family)